MAVRELLTISGVSVQHHVAQSRERCVGCAGVGINTSAAREPERLALFARVRSQPKWILKICRVRLAGLGQQSFILLNRGSNPLRDSRK
jgi:hypothetical protein